MLIQTLSKPEHLTAIKHLHAGPRYSESRIHAGTIYLAGQVSTDQANDIGGQTCEVLGMVDRLLAESGSGKQQLLMVHLSGEHGRLCRHEQRVGRVGAQGPCTVQGDGPEARLAEPRAMSR